MHSTSAGDPKVIQIEANHPGIVIDLPATTSNRFRAVDCSRPNDFFLDAKLNRGGLSFAVVTVRTALDRSSIHAKNFFAAAMKWFGAANVQEIDLTWIEVGSIPQMPGVIFDTNFRVFLSHYNSTMDNRIDAAKETPSYKIVAALPWGFSTIVFVSLDPADPRQFGNQLNGRLVLVKCKR